MDEGGFFPPGYDRFAFEPGDVLAQRDGDGWVLTRVLAVDRVTVRAGETIAIAGQVMTATSDDTLRVIGCAFDETGYPSLDLARAAALEHRFEASLQHVPMRSTFLGPDDVRLASWPVSPAELVGYRAWREAFSRGEAGIF